MTAALDCESAIGPRRSAGGMFRKGFWAIADQGLFAGSNCIVNVMLARWLSPMEYGAFATAFAAFLALGVIHTSLLTEPMLVFSPDRYRDRHRQYFGVLVHGHLLVSLCAVGDSRRRRLVFRFPGPGRLGAGNVLVRRRWAVHSVPLAHAANLLWAIQSQKSGDGRPAYFVLMMLGLAVVHAVGTLTIGAALTIIGLSSLVVGVALGIGQIEMRPAGPLVRDVVAEHLRYGRWATATQILGFIPGNIYYFLLPTMATLEQSGALRAMTNLYMPLLQAIAGAVPAAPAGVRADAGNRRRQTPAPAFAAGAGGWAAALLARLGIIQTTGGGAGLRREISGIFRSDLDSGNAAGHRGHVRSVWLAATREAADASGLLGRRGCGGGRRHPGNLDDPGFRTRGSLLEHRHHLLPASHHAVAVQPPHDG